MIYMFLADGFEEIEALATLDVLRRGGVEISTVGVGKTDITGAHNIKVIADLSETDVDYDAFEGVVLPGGLPGTTNLEKCETVQKTLDVAYETDKLICAICAAPSILGHKGFLKDKEAICFPGFEKELIGAKLSKKRVVADDGIVTAIGAGASFEFGFKILEILKGKEVADNLKTAMKA